MFTDLSAKFKDTRQRTLDDPSLTMGSDKRNQYDALYNRVFGANGTLNKQAGLDQYMTTALKNHRDVYEVTSRQLLESDGGESIYKQMSDAGFPPIMNEDNTLMNFEEYQELVIKGIESGNITNPDLGNWTWDTGTSNKDYMIDAVEMVEEFDATYGRYVMRAKPVYNNDGSRAKMIDKRAVDNEANRYYKETKKQIKYRTYFW